MRTDVDPEPPQADTKNLAASATGALPLMGSADQLRANHDSASRDRLLQEDRETEKTPAAGVVLQLDAPPQEDGGGRRTSQFERAFALARFLCSREMAGVKTVAFVPHTLRGHGVLLALACEEIVMSAEAMIGEAGADEPPGTSLRETLVAAYREIAETQRTIPVALAVAMIDPSVEVLQVEAEDGTHFSSRG